MLLFMVHNHLHLHLHPWHLGFVLSRLYMELHQRKELKAGIEMCNIAILQQENCVQLIGGWKNWMLFHHVPAKSYQIHKTCMPLKEK